MADVFMDTVHIAGRAFDFAKVLQDGSTLQIEVHDSPELIDWIKARMSGYGKSLSIVAVGRLEDAWHCDILGANYHAYKDVTEPVGVFNFKFLKREPVAKPKPRYYQDADANQCYEDIMSAWNMMAAQYIHEYGAKPRGRK